MPQTILLDVDTGVDDALAIMLAIHSPSLRLAGITTVSGNTGSRQAALNTRFILRKLAGKDDLPVVAGALESLARGVPDRAADVHGGDGLGGVFEDFIKSGAQLPEIETRGMDAAGFILEQARIHKENLRIVATGPVTNLALALQKDPEAFLKVGQILIMGGAVEVKGNIRELVEFNASCDPEALASVLECGVPAILFPLDVTRQVRLRPTSFNDHRGEVTAEKVDLIRGLIEGYLIFCRREYGIEGVYMHDVFPVAYVIRPDLFELKSGILTVDCSSAPTAGKTRWAAPGEKGGFVQVATGVDERAFLEVFWQALGRRAFASPSDSL
ncbi:MAG: nucleoside hydrolase [Acidobacteria bacterium]|nr:MAG: nucleoside hydrolase [Acidobacteriota bacterium]